ncbi:MAG: hypothetical protein V4534_02785 [Myxococcota bacterium]
MPSRVQNDRRIEKWLTETSLPSKLPDADKLEAPRPVRAVPPRLPPIDRTASRRPTPASGRQTTVSVATKTAERPVSAAPALAPVPLTTHPEGMKATLETQKQLQSALPFFAKKGEAAPSSMADISLPTTWRRALGRVGLLALTPLEKSLADANQARRKLENKNDRPDLELLRDPSRPLHQVQNQVGKLKEGVRLVQSYIDALKEVLTKNPDPDIETAVKQRITLLEAQRQSVQSYIHFETSILTGRNLFIQGSPKLLPQFRDALSGISLITEPEEALKILRTLRETAILHQPFANEESLSDIKSALDIIQQETLARIDQVQEKAAKSYAAQQKLYKQNINETNRRIKDLTVQLAQTTADDEIRSLNRQIERLKYNYRLAIHSFQEANFKHVTKVEDLNDLRYQISSVRYLKNKATFAFQKSTMQLDFSRLEREHQLSLNGMDINEARKRLATRLNGQDIFSALNLRNGASAPLVIKQLLEKLYSWAKEHPREAIFLSGDLQQLYDQIQGTGIIGSIWSRSDMETQVREMLIGDRTILEASQHTVAPMPPELIALLDLLSMAPEGVNVTTALMGQNPVANTISAITTVVTGSWIPGLIAAGAVGYYTSTIKRAAASTLNEYTDNQIAISALINGITFEGDYGAKLETALNTVANRQFTTSIGSFYSDFKEGGLQKAMLNMRRKFSHWWEISEPTEKRQRAIYQTLGAVGGTAVVGALGAGAIFTTIATGGIAAGVGAAILLGAGAVWAGYRVYTAVRTTLDTKFATTRRLVKEALTRDRMSDLKKEIMRGVQHKHLSELFDTSQNRGDFLKLPSTAARTAWLKQEFETQLAKRNGPPTAYQAQLNQWGDDLNRKIGEQSVEFWEEEADKFHSELRAST